MKIYTKTGDKGETSLFGGERVKKDDPRIEAYGTVDELNSAIGLAISFLPISQADLQEILLTVQHHLLDIGSELSSLSDKKSRSKAKVPEVTAKKVTWLEKHIDTLDKDLTQLTQFILPGGTQAASALHLARTICRRAERKVITLSAEHETNSELIRYLNRLSDFLFTAARFTNVKSGNGDVSWKADRD